MKLIRPVWMRLAILSSIITFVATIATLAIDGLDGFRGFVIRMIGFGVFMIWLTAAAVIAAVNESRRKLRTREIKTNLDPFSCPTCGYDLRASPERCPECGMEVAKTKTGHE